MKKEYRVFIIEDEPLIAAQIESVLIDSGYICAGTADNFSEAKEKLSSSCPDLILLDINLGDGPDGIDLAHYINQHIKKPFIYVSSNTDSKTMERVKLTCPFGFIVKPFRKTDIETQADLAIHSHQLQKENAKVKFDESFLQKDSFFVRDKHSLVKINYSDIYYAEACDNYTILYTVNARLIVSYSLKIMEEKLDAFNFYRAHRSFLININHIQKINPKEIIINGKEIPLSEANKTQLLSLLNKL